MAEPRKIVQGGLKALEAASKAVDAEDAAAKAVLSTARGVSREADKAMEAKRLAMEAANPPIKASEAYGQHEGAYLKPIFYDRMKVDLSQGKKGGPGFSSIQLVDPNYADAKAVAGVTDQKMATRILNRNKAGVPAGAKVIWTPSVGGLEQHKSNSTMFGQFADIFASQRKNMTPEQIQKLSDRASNAVDNNGRLIFPNGIDLGARNFRQQVKTYDQRALMADIFAGRGVGGEKGRTVPVEELLEKNLDPNVAQAGTLDLGNRLFRLEGNVIDRPDLHTDYRKILTGEDLNVNYIPVPIRTVYEDWELQKAAELAAQGKNRGVTLMDYTKNDPTIQLTEELLTKMQKAGHKKGGPVKESEKDMAEFQKRFALHKATGGKVNIPRLTLKKADGGKIAKGLMGAINKASAAVDAATAEANLAKFREASKVPQRLYHGTMATEGGKGQEAIRRLKPSKEGALGSGVYLTPNSEFASTYAGFPARSQLERDIATGSDFAKESAGQLLDRMNRGAIESHEIGGNMLPVYAQLKNPLILEGKGDPMIEALIKLGMDKDKAARMVERAYENKGYIGKEVETRARAAGYDGLMQHRDGELTEVVVYNPNAVKSAIGNQGTYDITHPDLSKAKGGAVQHDSLKDLEEFHRRFALHKATGGKINIPRLSLKRVKKFDGGGMAVQSPEETVTPFGGEKSRGAKIAEKLYEMAKEQGKEEVSSLKKPRALTDLLNRGVLANNPISAGVDLVNMGLGAVGLGSEKPFLGSEHIKDLMDKYGVTSGEERPLMETGLSFLSPTAVIKGAQKTADVAKKAPEMVQRATDAFTSSKLSPLATEAKTASAGKPTGATYATKQEGPFFRVRPTSLDQSTAKGRGVREADEFQGTTPVGGGAGSSGSAVPTRLSDEEVARIIADPAANEPLNIAKKYTQETQGTEFTLPDIPESSLVKQSAIGRAHQLAVEGTPEYKSSVFDAYAREMPEVLEQSGAKNYDDLMEKAYRQLAKETDAQFQALPYNFSYHRAGEGNYQSSKEMAADVHGNKHLYVFQGGDPHDFLNRIDPVTGLNENEKFRAVHDLLGHAIYGNQFGPKGEEVAWAIHSQMYSPLARLAMTAETRGQNSMVNYSPLNAALKAEIAKYDSLASEARRRGDTALLNEINAAKRQAYSGFQYAPQKAVLLPPEFLDPKYAGGMPSYLEAANRPAKGTETQSVLTHFSHNPELQFVDPKRYGTGIKGAEAERLRDFPGGVRDRSYFYMGEPGAVKPEPGLGVNRYRGEASSLYDITQDPLNFRVLARESNRTPYTAKYNQGITSPLQEANDIERLVKEYGYQGMANPKASKPMAIMFKETPVRRNARGGLTLMK